MRHSASLVLTLPGDVVLREPTSFERIKKLLLPASMAPDLSTPERQIDRNLVSLTEGLCAALHEVGVNDAVYLAVDGRTVYYDALGVPNDVERLLEAAQAHVMLEPFQELRGVFMQLQEGLELLYEVTFRRRFQEDAPAAFLAVSARLGGLRPHIGETLDASRARLHTVLGDGELSASLRAYFDELVDRLHKSLESTFPGGTVARHPTSTFIVRPSPHAVRELARRGLADPRPRLRERPVCYHQTRGARPYYDPWDCYFDDGGGTWVALTELNDLISSTWLPANVMVDVVDSGGALLCHAVDTASHLELFTGIVDLASQNFAALDLSSLTETVTHFIGELPELTPHVDPVITMPDLFTMAESGSPDLGGESISGVLQLGRSLGESIGESLSNAASSIFDAVSDIDWSSD